MDRIGSIFIEIKKQINYIINDNEILYSNNYFNCIDEIMAVLRNTLYKLQDRCPQLTKSLILHTWYKIF